MVSVTPYPKTITLDLPEEYLDFLDIATETNALSHQDVIRAALAMLRVTYDKHADEALRDYSTFNGERIESERKSYLAAWDRWNKTGGQQVTLDDGLAAFVAEQVKDEMKDVTAVVVLALLCYAKVMGLGFTDEWDDEAAFS